MNQREQRQRQLSDEWAQRMAMAWPEHSSFPPVPARQPHEQYAPPRRVAQSPDPAGQAADSGFGTPPDINDDFYGTVAAGLRLGRPEAVAALIDALGTKLYDYLSLMLGDRDVATHALADTLIVALGHVGRLREPRLPSWLFALARTERKRRQRAASARAMPDVLGVLTALARLDPAPEITTWAERAYLAMARMEPQEREILVLSAMRPVLSAADIAQVFGASHVVAADLHRRAARRLREETASLGFDPGASAVELLGAMSGYLLGCVPRERVMYMCVGPELAGRRRRIQAWAGPFRADGFPAVGAYVPGPVRVASHRRAPRPIPLMPFLQRAPIEARGSDQLVRRDLAHVPAH